MKKFTPIEVTKETVKLFQQAPDTERKVEYYKGVLHATANLINSIDERIKKGYSVEKYSFMGLRFTKRIILDSYLKSKLQVEKLDAEYQLEAQKNYYEMWLERKKEYEKKFEFYSKECESRFDEIFKLAKEVASRGNIRLASVIDKFDEKCDNKTKVESYLYFKQEVENHFKHSKNKIDPNSVNEKK